MEIFPLFCFASGWFLAGFVNGVTGFGAAMVAMPFAVYAMDIHLAVPACSLMGLIVSLEQGWRYKGFADWQRVYPMACGAIPGAFAGVMALRFFSPVALKGGLALFLLGYAFWGLALAQKRIIVIGNSWGCAAGFFSTVFGTALSINGPPLAVYATLSGWDKQSCKAGLAVFFIISCVLMLTAQAAAGLHNAQTLLAMAVAAPGSIVGAYCGLRVTRRMGDALYQKLLLLFIGMTGCFFAIQVLGM